MKHDQFTLPFLDTTSLGGGIGLYGGFTAAKPPALPQMNLEPEEAEVVDSPNLAKPTVPAHEYRRVGDRPLAHGWKARARDNLAAIRLMTAIEAEGRHARPDEQEQLAKFTAFGATDLADKLFRRAGEGFAPAWEDLGLELEELVSREDLTNLRRATQHAHFTPEFMIHAIWRALCGFGFGAGRVLEPGCGTGLFFALAPEALAGKIAITGVEMDAVTARIAKLLYPNARIRHEDFTKARLPEVFDLAIGNPPFSDRTVRADDPAGKLRLSLHDYFIARSIERLRPGGLAAFVTSRWTLDKADQTAREHIASMADLNRWRLLVAYWQTSVSLWIRASTSGLQHRVWRRQPLLRIGWQIRLRDCLRHCAISRAPPIRVGRVGSERPGSELDLTHHKTLKKCGK
jgi:SAM-dependent methyltransferase